MGDDEGMRRGGWILLLLLAGVMLVVVGNRDLTSQDEPRATASAQTHSPQSRQGLPREHRASRTGARAGSSPVVVGSSTTPATTPVHSYA